MCTQVPVFPPHYFWGTDLLGRPVLYLGPPLVLIFMNFSLFAFPQQCITGDLGVPAAGPQFTYKEILRQRAGKMCSQGLIFQLRASFGYYVMV
jgi:hypothetical protein